MTGSLGVRESTRFVVDRARHVRIAENAVERLAERLIAVDVPPPEWDTRYHLPASGELLAQYIFILDVCNFCFWGDPKWRVEYRGEILDGYWAAAAALRRSVEDGVPLLEAGYLSGLTDSEAAKIFAGSVEIPLLGERTSALRAAGRALLEKYDGRFAGLLAGAGASAVRLVEAVVDTFPSFDDVATYDNLDIHFYKRAQILAADLHLSGAAASLGGAFTDAGELTAFADYKVPQVLRAFGVLEYSEEASTLVDRMIEIPAGDALEVEIRAATVQAVEQVRAVLAAKGSPKSSVEIDWLLWNLGQGDLPGMKPYHRTRTTYY